MKDYSTKDFRKIAFAVGLGYVVGKNVGELLNCIIDGVFNAEVIRLAKNGNEVCKHVCVKCGIDYENEFENESNDDETKVVGFLRQ